MTAMTPQTLTLLTSAAGGLCVLTLTRWLQGALTSRPSVAALSLFETQRREQMRQGSAVYRTLEPMIDRLAAWYRAHQPERLERLGHSLRLAAEKLPWQPAEYLAARQLEGVLAGLTAALMGYLSLDSLPVAVVFGGAAGWSYPVLMAHDVSRRARQRRGRLKERLPYLVDLMALTMEAGATFAEALATAVQENAGHPVAEEFGEVLRETELGRSGRDALLALQQRLNDENVGELIFAIVKGEEMGTPLAQILRSQADQMRLKRSQTMEKEAAEAQVAIIFPGMLVMIACLLLIVAPFLLHVMADKKGLASFF